MNTVLVDTNIILRFLLRDNDEMFTFAKAIFDKAESGKSKVYLDELVVAEVIWTLVSFYKQPKKEVADLLAKLTSQKWITNPKKKLILRALGLCSTTNLSYIDCWLAEEARKLKIPLQTFDKKLRRQD